MIINGDHRATICQSLYSVLHTHGLIYFSLQPHEGGRYYFYPHSRDKDTQNQKGVFLLVCFVFFGLATWLVGS